MAGLDLPGTQLSWTRAVCLLTFFYGTGGGYVRQSRASQNESSANGRRMLPDLMTCEWPYIAVLAFLQSMSKWADSTTISKSQRPHTLSEQPQVRMKTKPFTGRRIAASSFYRLVETLYAGAYLVPYRVSLCGRGLLLSGWCFHYWVSPGRTTLSGSSLLQ